MSDWGTAEDCGAFEGMDCHHCDAHTFNLWGCTCVACHGEYAKKRE